MKKTVAGGAFVASAVIAMSAAWSQTVGPMPASAGEPISTVAQAVEAAVDNQPEVKARWAAYQASGDDRRAAKAGYLPTVDVNGEIGTATRDYDGRDWFTRDRAEVTLSQMLFDGFLTRSRVQQADHTRLTRYYELLDAVQEKALEAIVAYEDVRQYRATTALAEQNLAAHGAVLKLMKERTQSGVGTGADLEQASGRYALAEANLLTEQANLYDVTARFQRIVGKAPASTLADYQVAADQVPTDFQAVLSESVKRHPSLFAAHAQMSAAQAAIGEAKAGYYPRVTFDARAGTYRNTGSFDSQYDPRTRGEEAFVGVNLNYNLFRGGADKARENASERRFDQSRELLNKACVDLRQTASISWNNVENLKVKMTALDAHRTGSASVATAYEHQFYVGRRSLLDVLDAKNEAFQSQRSYAQAGHELNKSRYRTLYSMGVLLDVLGQTRSGMPTVNEVSRVERPGAIDCSGAFAG